MVTAVVALGFAIGICGEVGADDDVAGEELPILGGGVGVAAWVIFTDQALRDALVLVDNLPFAVLGLVSAQDALGRDLLRLFAGVVETG